VSAAYANIRGEITEGERKVMAVLKTLRDAPQCPPSGRHPYIDTPDFAYDQWLSHLDQNQKPIGTVTGNPLVAVIGGGVSGLCAAYELMRAGCSVTVFEQASDVGGRCASHLFATGATDIAEMGSMRFPPTEFILNYYLQKLNILPGGLCNDDLAPPFPDPGVERTYVCYGNNPPVVWQKTKETPAPAGFETVSAGWNALMGDGLLQNGVVQLQSAQTITNTLAANDVDTAAQYWQAYLDVFGQETFYSALYKIFTGSSGYTIPGGTAWSFEDFDRFGALGLGSGGFGPFYPISFMDIFRLIVNELETTQKFLRPSSSLTDGIRSLPLYFAGAVNNSFILPPLSPNGTVMTGTAVSSIVPVQGGFTLLGTDGAPLPGLFAKVIVATTTRSMELTLGLSNYGTNALVSPAVAQGIMRTHIVSSNKVAARITNFWSADPDNAVRCLQSDDLAHQVYTLDYTPVGAAEEDKTGVCFISYVWDDDAVKQQAITSGVPNDPEDRRNLYEYLLNRLATIGEPVASWTTNLQPLNGEVVFEEWQSHQYFGGAFKLSQPGQDKYVQTMFFDYQKCLTPALDTGVYIAGDCISWTSGWVEGALTTGLNAAAGVIQSLGGTVNPDQNGNTPLKIQANRYSYF
jgi:tryptophan 2-monooxygenase